MSRWVELEVEGRQAQRTPVEGGEIAHLRAFHKVLHTAFDGGYTVTSRVEEPTLRTFTLIGHGKTVKVSANIGEVRDELSERVAQAAQSLLTGEGPGRVASLTPPGSNVSPPPVKAPRVEIERCRLCSAVPVVKYMLCVRCLASEGDDDD